MLIASRIGYLVPTQLEALQQQMDTVGRLLTGLRKAIQNRVSAS